MKIWRRMFLLALPLAAGLSVWAQQDSVYSLKACIETGINNNLKVRQSHLQMDADEISWKQSRLNLLPTLNGSISQGVNQGRSIDPFTNSYVNERVDYANYGISSSLILFNGFSLQNAVKQTSLAFEASRMDWQQEKDNLTINIILAYLQVLNNQDLLEQAHNRMELTRQQVDRLVEMNKLGAISPPVLSDLRGQLAGDQLSIINAEQSLETARLSLCQLMNIPYNPSMKLENMQPASFAAIYSDGPDQVYAAALQHFALVKSVALRKQSAEKGVKVTQGQLFPTLSLGADGYTNYSSAAMQNSFLGNTTVASSDFVDVNGTQYPVMKQQSNFKSEKITYGSQLSNNMASSIGLTLRVPLFNNLQVRNRVKLARITLKNAEITEESTRIQLRQSIDQAWINMETGFKRFKALTDQVDSYTQSFEAAEVRFNAGVGTSIDYLTAKNNLEQARINRIIAKYDYLLRCKILDYYQGRASW